MHDRVLVLIAEHPDEWQTDTVCQKIQSQSAEGVDVILANDWAMAQPRDGNGRLPRLYAGENLTHVFPGDPAGTPAQRRAHELSGIISLYKKVISVHGNECGSEYVFYGATADTVVRGLACALGFTQALIHTGESAITTTHPQILGIELQPGGPLTIDDLVAVLPQIAASTLPTPEIPLLEEYRFVRGVTSEIARTLCLPRQFKQFEQIPQPYAARLVEFLGIASVALYANSWNADIYEGRTGYWGELTVAVDRL